MRTGLDGEIQSAEILLPNCTMITRAINFLCPSELPTLQEEKQELRKDGGNMQEQITDRSNIIIDVFNEGQTIEPNATDGSIYEESISCCLKIFGCIRDNGIFALFCLSPGRLS